MKTWTLLMAVLFTAGCTKQSLSPDFGESTALNRDAQVINPQAGQGRQSAHTLDGIKADQSVEDYHSEDSSADDERLIRDVTD